MSEGSERTDGRTAPPAFRLLAPRWQKAPLIVSSPHSGDYYPPDFIAASQLDALTLRRSEDCFVEELCGAAPSLGLPLIAATHARAYVDCNRESFELDPDMFQENLPDYVNRSSSGVLTGFGTVPRRVTPDHEIYARPLSLGEVLRRIETVHRPYHEALSELVAETHRRFGCAFLIDMHSMPSLAAPPGLRPAGFVLGDRYGETAPPALVGEVERFLRLRGYAVARNVPYAGGFITRHYARPAVQSYSLQIEIDRALYMDQDTFRPARGFTAIKALLSALMEHVADWTLSAQGRKAAE
jgi:N-formylglutamate deformylase